MAALRDEMAKAGQTDGVVKLILPEDQIKLLERDMPQGASLDAAARDAVDGQTPYAVTELRIDALERDGRLHVAAVAVETLEEAEAFALEHGFAPMGFVAAQGNGFGREVCFGSAESWSGKALKPDSTPLRIVPMPEPEREAEPAPEEETAAEASAEDARTAPLETTPPETTPQQTEAPVSARESDPADAAADHGRDAQSAAPTPEPPAIEAAKADKPTEVKADKHTEAEVDTLDREDESDASSAEQTEPSVPSEAKPYPVRARAADPLADPKAAPPVRAPAAPTPPMPRRPRPRPRKNPPSCRCAPAVMRRHRPRRRLPHRYVRAMTARAVRRACRFVRWLRTGSTVPWRPTRRSSTV